MPFYIEARTQAILDNTPPHAILYQSNPKRKAYLAFASLVLTRTKKATKHAYTITLQDVLQALRYKRTEYSYKLHH